MDTPTTPAPDPILDPVLEPETDIPDESAEQPEDDDAGEDE